MSADNINITLQNNGLKNNCDVQLDRQQGSGVFSGSSFSPNNSASGSITGLVYPNGAAKTATYQTTISDIGNTVKIKIGPPTGSNQNPACNPQSSYEQYSYSITCTPKKGNLEIIKKTQGGDATFNVLATPGTGSAINYEISTTSGEGKLTKSVNVGSYTISETPPAGWELVSISCGTSGTTATVTEGATTTCTVTNRRQTGNLNINKLTKGGIGSFKFVKTSGPGTISDFTLATLAENTPSPSANFTSLPTGDYEFDEDLPPGWTLTGITCSGSGLTPTLLNGTLGTGRISVAKDASGTCTFTNERDARKPRLTLMKTVQGGSAKDKDFTLSFSGPVSGSGVTGGSGITNVEVAPGTYTLAEATQPNYTLTALKCNGSDVIGTKQVTIGTADVTCEFVNTYVEPKATITIQKQVVGGPGGTFSFTSNVAGLDKAAMDVAAGATVTVSTAVLTSFDPVTVTEKIDAGSYVLTSAKCVALDDEGSTTPDNGGGTLSNGTLTVTPSPGEDLVCTFVNTYVERKASITIKKQLVGGPGGTFSFASSEPSLNNAGLAVAAGATVTVSTAAITTFTNVNITETINSGPYVLTSAKCEIAGGGTPDNGAGTLSDSTLTVKPSPGEDIVCTFVNTEKKDNRSSEETKRFVNRRLDNLLTYGPDRARMLRRLGEAPPEQQSLKDGPMKLNGAAPAPSASAPASRTSGTSALADPFASRTPTGSMALGANPFSTATQQTDLTDPARPDMQLQTGPTSTATGILANMASKLMPAVQDGGTIKFSTSLSELRAVASAAEQQRQNDLMMKAGLNFADTPFVTQPNTLRPGLDVWVEGTIVRYNDDLGGVNRDGDFSVLYVGADYVISPGVLIGALVQVDDTDEDIDDPTLKGNIDGRGWLAGPYIGIRLADNLYFDARAAWGQSDNSIDLTDTSLGQRTGSFETDRWLASATLTGNEYYGAWRFSPQIGIAYGEEDYSSYTTSLQQTIPGSGASIGRVTGTMEVGYRFNGYDGSVIEPHVAISGIWNFDSDDLYVNGILADTDESRARVEGGLLITTPSGVGLRGAAGYDGIGASDFEAVSGSLWINIPLN